MTPYKEMSEQLWENMFWGVCGFGIGIALGSANVCPIALFSFFIPTCAPRPHPYNVLVLPSIPNVNVSPTAKLVNLLLFNIFLGSTCKYVFPR